MQSPCSQSLQLLCMQLKCSLKQSMQPTMQPKRQYIRLFSLSKLTQPIFSQKSPRKRQESPQRGNFRQESNNKKIFGNARFKIRKTRIKLFFFPFLPLPTPIPHSYISFNYLQRQKKESSLKLRLIFYISFQNSHFCTRVGKAYYSRGGYISIESDTL